jgi:hypothetical protein
MFKRTMARLCSVVAALIVFLLCFVLFGTAPVLAAQNPLAEHMIRGLEGLKEIKIVLMPNDINDKSTMRVMSTL